MNLGKVAGQAARVGGAVSTFGVSEAALAALRRGNAMPGAGAASRPNPLPERRQAIAQQYAEILGRPPRKDEEDYFLGLMTDDAISPFEVGQIIQGLPEFQSRQLNQNADAYSQRLGAADQDILAKSAAAANSQFANQGRGVTSAMGAQVAQAGASLAQQRQALLAQFYGQGLQNNQALTQQYGQNGLERGYGLRDESRQRAYQMADMDKYQNISESYLNRQRSTQRNQMYGQLAGTAVGSLGFLGGPTNGFAGMKAGSAVGGNIGGLF